MASRDQLTKKERREQARQERLEREAAERERQQRVKRMWQLGAAAALVVVVVVVAVVVSSSSGPSGLKKGGQGNQLGRTVNAAIAGIPQSASTLGSPKAPVKLDYYGDLQCPVCQEFTLQSLPQVIQQDVRSGKLQITYRSLETATPDTTTFVTQQVAALAAGNQNKLWQYIELFYRQQGQEGSGYVTESFLSGIAQQVPGLDLTKWKADRNNQALQNQVSADEQKAQSQNFNSTPTLVLHGPKGTKGATGALSFSQFQQLFQQVS